ncbi:MAG: P1 family peptidase, partial [Bilophila wadsworthia]
PKEDGSIIIVVATDAPLTPDQCKRLARRAGLGLGRTGGLAFDGSGDIFIAFSTANRLGSNAGGGPREHTVRTLSHGCMDPLFRATVEATHEAIVNAMCAATDTDGILGRRMYALPLDEVRGIMRRYESL